MLLRILSSGFSQQPASLDSVNDLDEIVIYLYIDSHKPSTPVEFGAVSSCCNT